MFRIFYQDGPAEPDCIPSPRGVQAIVQDHEEVGVQIVTSADYYVNEDGTWRGVDIFGLFDYLMDTGQVLFGRTISRDEYQQVIRWATEAKEKWPVRGKQTWLPGERKFK